MTYRLFLMMLASFLASISALALAAMLTVSHAKADTLTVGGVISPWLWDYDHYYQGELIDPGLFGPRNQSLTGLPIQIVWNTEPAITAAVTINGVTITLGPALGFYAPYAMVGDRYQNITICNCYSGNVAVNSYEPLPTEYHPPLFLGGGFEFLGPDASCNVAHVGLVQDCMERLDGYFYVTSFSGPAQAPGPVAGSGLAGLLALAGLALVRARKWWARP